MKLRCRLNKTFVILGSKLGGGGEANVYELVNRHEPLVAKIYHKFPNKELVDKLLAMLVTPPDDPMSGKGHASIAWPVDLLEDPGTGQVMGFLMPRVRDMHRIVDFYNPTLRLQQCPLFDYGYLHHTARNLASAVRALHARSYVIGDVNESNILASKTTLITLIDTDSFQVHDPGSRTLYRCRVGTPEYTPPELQGKSFAQIDRSFEHDFFGLGVVIFRLLMQGVHPFVGVYIGNNSDPSTTTEALIKAGHFPYSTGRFVPYKPGFNAPSFDVLHPRLQQLFIRCFEDGHSTPSMRPDAKAWQDALEEAEQSLITCSLNKQHKHGKHLTKCPWCERARALNGHDLFPSEQVVKAGQHLKSANVKQTPLKPPGQPFGNVPHVIQPNPGYANPVRQPRLGGQSQSKPIYWLPVLLLLVYFVFHLEVDQKSNPVESTTKAQSQYLTNNQIDFFDRNSNKSERSYISVTPQPQQLKTLSESEKRQVIADKVHHNQQSGLVDDIITKETIALSGSLTSVDAKTVGSGGFWGFSFEAVDDKAHYGFGCNDYNELYFRIDGNDVNWTTGTKAMRTHPNRVTLYFRSQDWDFVQRCSRGSRCDGSACPLAIVVEPYTNAQNTVPNSPLADVFGSRSLNVEPKVASKGVTRTSPTIAKREEWKPKTSIFAPPSRDDL
ncbi:helix-hairpin-helix domain-containing protein [Candidatus Methylomicrobium oryzae]|uniref:helix-hairpin-helix domain-containing protein n=1 Tax=Candidatus Methylomicrobium oryzae TaxID=2802053 RepID=UPI00192426A8|nr:hypothetical protein [Methylomicrobium sp. RS1]MBL1263464.1 hypothetical protein [Methylomicrobium sp. RS1]